jgi:hypothetical protein
MENPFSFHRSILEILEICSFYSAGVAPLPYRLSEEVQKEVEELMKE